MLRWVGPVAKQRTLTADGIAILSNGQEQVLLIRFTQLLQCEIPCQRWQIWSSVFPFRLNCLLKHNRMDRWHFWTLLKNLSI